MLDATVRAADLSGRELLRERHGAGAARQPPPEHRAATRRLPRRTASSSSRSATTISGAGSARSPALPEDARFATNRQRVTGYAELRPFVADRLRDEPRQHWIDRLTAAGVPCGSVRNFKELFEDPQLAAREMIARVEHATIGQLQALGVPVKLSDTPGAVKNRRRRRSASTPRRCS